MTRAPVRAPAVRAHLAGVPGGPGQALRQGPPAGAHLPPWAQVSVFLHWDRPGGLAYHLTQEKLRPNCHTFKRAAPEN
jgi:hypothetical protein